MKKERFRPVIDDRDNKMSEVMKRLERVLRKDGLDPADTDPLEIALSPSVRVPPSDIETRRRVSLGDDQALYGDTLLNSLMQHVRWRNSGRVIFDLAPGLADAFLQTEARVSHESLFFTLHSFYLTSSTSLGYMDGEEVDGMYVSVLDKSIFVLVTNGPNCVRFAFMTENAVDLEDQLIAMGEDGRIWGRLVVNTLLYLSTDDADVERAPFVPDWVSAEAATRSKKMGERFIKQHDDTTILYSTIGKKLGATLDPRITSSRDEAQRENDKRFIVRGHWRQQAHGVDLRLRKNIWIKPFWKGPEWAEVIATRVQKVVDDTDNGVGA